MGGQIMAGTSRNKLILNIKEKNKRGVEFYLNFNWKKGIKFSWNKRMKRGRLGIKGWVWNKRGGSWRWVYCINPVDRSLALNLSSFYLLQPYRDRYSSPNNISWWKRFLHAFFLFFIVSSYFFKPEFEILLTPSFIFFLCK